MHLTRYQKYSREDIHNIFSPNLPFVPGAGKWGLQGIISVPNTTTDFIFFVTFGTTIAHHTFKEGITEDGILTWQSKPGQKLTDPQIKQLINYDYNKRNIYLLLRTNKKNDYVYLGNLAYESHNPEKEKPVQFQWQILDWEINEELFKNIGLKLGDEEIDADPYSDHKVIEIKDTLIKSDLKPISRKPQSRTNKTKKITKVDFLKKAERNQSIGLKGELLVVDMEKEKLKQLGIQKEVVHISLEGDGYGYDILSYDENGQPIYIEVKTTLGGINTPFDISINEVLFSNENPDNYFVYRLFNYNELNNSAEFYEEKGSVSKSFNLEATQFKAYYHENIINVVCGVIFKENKVLIARRKEEKSLGGYWEFPGGKLEEGETPETALKRELLEELGMHVKIENYLSSVIHSPKQFSQHKLLYFILLFIFEIQINNQA